MTYDAKSGSPGRVSSLDCKGWLVSNDTWTPEGVERMRNLLSKQHVAPERATAVTFGLSAVPYALGHLGATQFHLFDRHDTVLGAAQRRIGLTKETATWEEWLDLAGEGLTPRLKARLAREYQNAAESGLRLDPVTTATAVAATEVIGHHGDLIDGIPILGTELHNLGRTVVYANVTNVAAYLSLEEGDHPSDTGREAMAGLLDRLPLDDNAVIVESASSPLLHTKIMTPGEYFNSI